MDWGVLPIVNENDTVSVSELKFGDNDCLASLLVNLIGADLYINLTSAPGVYAANPQEVPDAGILECVEDVAGLDLGRMCGGRAAGGSLTERLLYPLRRSRPRGYQNADG